MFIEPEIPLTRRKDYALFHERDRQMARATVLKTSPQRNRKV
jgi:hypothetical protein